MATRERNYRKEYDTYHGTPEQIKARDSRNAARNAAVKRGVVHKGDGKEIDHKDGNPRNNSPKNLQVMSRTANRKKGG
jgi:hypothetical protein